MKRILLILLMSGIFFKSYAQSSNTIDTFNVLQQQIVSHKTDFIGKPFNLLLDKLPFKIITYTNSPSMKKHKTFKAAFYFLTERQRQNADKITLVAVKWQSPLYAEDADSVWRKSKGSWTQDDINYFKDKIVGDINVYSVKVHK